MHFLYITQSGSCWRCYCLAESQQHTRITVWCSAAVFVSRRGFEQRVLFSCISFNTLKRQHKNLGQLAENQKQNGAVRRCFWAWLFPTAPHFSVVARYLSLLSNHLELKSWTGHRFICSGALAAQAAAPVWLRLVFQPAVMFFQHCSELQTLTARNKLNIDTNKAHFVCLICCVGGCGIVISFFS